MPTKKQPARGNGDMGDTLYQRTKFTITHLLEQNCSGEKFLPEAVEALSASARVLVTRRDTIPPLDICSLRFIIGRDRAGQVLITVTRISNDHRPISVPDKLRPERSEGHVIDIIDSCLPISLGIRIY